MGYASKQGHARVSSSNPRAQAICDRCGFQYTHDDLKWQYEYAGTGLVNRHFLVCDSCLDVPQNQLRAIVLPPDPVPISNPRVPDWVAMETDFRQTIGPTLVDPVTLTAQQTGDRRITEDDQPRVVQQNGDDMLAPPFEVDTRITTYVDETRVTERDNVRVTQLRLKVPPPPPRFFEKKTRITQDEDVRDTQKQDTRVTEYLPVEE